MSSPAGERSRPRSSSVRSVSSKTSAAGRTSMGQCEQPAGFDRSSSEHGSLSKLQEGYRSPTGQSGTSSAERVFPVSSIVYPSSTQGGEILSPSSSVAAQRDFSGDPSLSPTARSRPQRQSSYFGSSVRLQEPATIPEKSSGSTNNSPSTSEHPSSHTIHTSQRASGPIAENSDTYVQGLHRSQHEVHAEPDADEIIRRARAARQKHDSAEQASETGSSIRSGAEPLLTVRFEHQETEDGHMIITGREGEIQRCEDEPIHVPGAIQAWGVLLGIEITENGCFKVVQVSENSGHLLGLPPSYLFKQSCFTNVLDDEDEVAVLREVVETMPTSDADLIEMGPAHFELGGSGLPGTGLDGPQSRNEWFCWCSMHRPSREERPNFIVIEFELQGDILNPAQTQVREPFSEEERSGLSGLPYEPTEDDLLESTINAAKPIRQTRSRRKQQHSGGDFKGADIFQTLGQITDQLSKAEDLPRFLKIVVGIMQDLTNYHRVMVYQFDEQWNGQVVAELVDWTKTRDLYRGLHFPATDIPAQARELYRLNRVRLLYDRDQPTARMVCANRDELNKPINMTHLSLRAMSPIHIKYLANMGVRASCSVSITAFGSLWGLISMHSYGRFGFRINSQQRQLCRILGDSISHNIERLSYAQRLHSRKVINTVSSNSNPSGYIVARAEDLLSLFDAEFGCLSIGEEAKLLGQIENSQEVLAVLEYLRHKRFLTIQASENIVEEFEDLHYPGGFKVVSGLLLVPLSQSGRDFIVFFRRGQIKHIHWAGNPYDKYLSGELSGRSNLEPRTSFKLWSETVLGKCKAWTDDQFETASVLALVYGKFIDVWRQKEVALRSHELTNLLLANASHEVRTPLNHIVGYLEMALEGPLDQDTRENLTKSYSASKALIHVINDLLDLTRAEEGHALFLKDPLDLPTIVEEAICIYRDEATRRGIKFDVVCTSPKLPRTFIGDRGRTKQVIANICANATKHTSEGFIRVEWGRLENPQELSMALPNENEVMMYLSVQDTGSGIGEDKLDKLFRQFEQVDSFDPKEGDAPAQSALGLGLAVVARLTRTLGGQLRVESTEGQGSKFTIILPFSTDPVDSPAPSLRKTSSRGSMASGTSLRSGSSGQQSEIDSLVEAISSDHMHGRNELARAISHSPRADKPKQVVPPSSPGSINIEGSQFPLRPVRVQDSELDSSTAWQRSRASQTREASQRDPTAAPLTPPETPSEVGPNADAPTSTTWQPIPSQRPPLTPQQALPKLNVLIVEDDPINRAILHKKLVKEGHTVITSVHGDEAVRKFEEDSTYDIVLMDLQMPVCNGQDAARKIRAMEKKGRKADRPSHLLNGRVPIFAVSASLYERQRPEMLECGMDGWILKPINFERLKILLAGALSPEDRRSELYSPGQFEQGGWFTDVKV